MSLFTSSNKDNSVLRGFRRMDSRTIDWFLKYLPPSHNFVKVTESTLRITLDNADQRVYLVGQAQVSVVSGSAVICGYLLKTGCPSLYVCSSKSNALLCLEYAPGGAVVELHSVRNGLERIQFCQGAFSGILSMATEQDIFGLWYLKAPVIADVALYEPIDQWKGAAAELTSQAAPPVILVCGPRKVGKSSFARFIANSSLQAYRQVIMMDLDCGQTEFMPPGSVSARIITTPLLGPPFTHVGTADLAYFVGAASPSEDYIYYMKCVSSLIDVAMQRFRGNTPIIINTMGWITGLGLHLLQYVLQYIRPTHSIAFDQETNNNDNYVTRALYDTCPLTNHVKPFDANEKIAVAYMRPISNETNAGKIATPGDLRNLSLWSYLFYDRLHEIYDFDRSLMDFVPYVMPWDLLRIVWSSRRGSGLRAELAHAVANVSLVGLGISKDPNDIPLMIGVGIIRGISPQQRCYYIISPLPATVLAQLNCIVLGTMPLPPAIVHYKNRVEGPYMSYINNGDALGSSARKVRHNIQRVSHQNS